MAPSAEPLAEDIIHVGPPIDMPGWSKVDDLKDNPYAAAKPRARLVKKVRPSAPAAFEHVDDLKANPY